MLQVEMTDPAAELAALADWLLQWKKETGPFFQIVASKLGIPGDSRELLESMLIARQRVSDLRSFTARLNDPFFTPRVKGTVVTQLDAMGAVFSAPSFHQQYNIVVSPLTNEGLTSLDLFSKIVREHQPLRQISPDELEELKTTLLDLRKKLADAGSEDIPDWARPHLIVGLNRLLSCLNFFPFFGTEATIDTLFSVHAKTRLIAEAVTRDPATARSKKGSIVLGVLLALNAAGDLFNLPSQTAEAGLKYKGWMTSAIADKSQTPGTKLLTDETTTAAPADVPEQKVDEPKAADVKQ